VVLTMFSGCNWDFDFGDGIGFGWTSPGLEFVPKRFALGAAVVTAIESDGPSALVSAEDPDVIRVERIDSSHVELRAMGVGVTTIHVEEDGQVARYSVEVVVHERHEVLLVQQGWGVVPITPVNDKALLSNVPQRILVALYDSEGLLFGGGLSALTLPERSQDCEHQSEARFDERCIIFEEGLHTLHVEVAGEEEDLMLGAVSEERIVDILLLRTTEEDDAEPGDVIRVDVLGLTETGTRVYGLPEARTTADMDLIGPLAYRFEPSSSVELVAFEALGFEAVIAIRGAVWFAPALKHDCWSSLFFGC
jgi:hypothetical protein